MKTVYTTILVLISIFEIAFGQAANENYFYNGQKFGSELAFNPFTTIINGGFGMVLDGSERVDEIARMLGGKLSEQSRAHAEELLGTAQTQH